MNDCLLLPMFPWAPIVQTRAANWLTRFKWKKILSTLGRECIMKNLVAVLEKSNIEVSLLMHVIGYILPWTTIFCFVYFIMFKQLFVLHFHKDTFNFVPPMFYVGIWRSHHFMRGPPFFEGVAGGLWRKKTSIYIYIYIYINYICIAKHVMAALNICYLFPFNSGSPLDMIESGAWSVSPTRGWWWSDSVHCPCWNVELGFKC